jgi:flagellar biosynthesis/type III secretory pathway chaperone
MERTGRMDLDNQTAKQTYIQLLADTLKKKIEVLNQLMELTGKQETEITSEVFNEDNFMELITLKDAQIQKLNMLDDGFEHLFRSVSDELAAGKGSYAEKIIELKEYITVITDMSVKLQTMEARNKSKLEVLLATKRKNILKAKVSAQTATNYYKTMAMQHEAQSYFYDKKK